jgi:plasmid stabilization system protein ParE
VKRYRIIILPSAAREIGEAYEWLAGQNAEAADRWYNRLMEIIFSLDTFPERCPLAPENKFLRTEIREIFHGRRQYKYRTIFTVSENEVHVLHVLHVRHGARRTLGETESSEE